MSRYKILPPIDNGMLRLVLANRNFNETDLMNVDIPKNLESLQCSLNKIGVLSIPLPNSLKILSCYQSEIKKIESILPDSLKELSCWGNQLKELCKLPNNLLKLLCYDNLLTELPDLPYSLEVLFCGNPGLVVLPRLNNLSLKFLDCSHSILTSIPELPSTLIELNCAYNRITSLPDLSNCHNLKQLECQNNAISSITHLPNSIEVIECHNQYLTTHDFIFQIKSKIKIDRLPENITELKMDGEMPHFPWSLTYYNGSDKTAVIVKQIQHNYRETCIGKEETILPSKYEWDDVWQKYTMWLYRVDGEKYIESLNDFSQI